MSNLNRTKVRRESTSTMPSALPLGELAFNSDTSELFVGQGSTKIPSKVNQQDFNEVHAHILTKANKSEVRMKESPIKMEDLHSEVKSAITGGSVAVVGENAIGSENVKDLAITPDKIKYKGNKINKGDIYPFKNVMRQGTLWNPNTNLFNIILDCKLYGADPNKYYRIEFIGNGANIGGKPRYSIVFCSYNKDWSNKISLVGYTNEQFPSNAPTEDIETRVWNINDTLTLVLTMDYSAMTQSQINIEGNGTDRPSGYGMVIDPMCYLPRVIRNITNDELKDKTINHSKIADEGILASNIKSKSIGLSQLKRDYTFGGRINPNYETNNTLVARINSGVYFVDVNTPGMPPELASQTCTLEVILCENTFMYQKIYKYSDTRTYYTRVLDSRNPKDVAWIKHFAVTDNSIHSSLIAPEGVATTNLAPKSVTASKLHGQYSFKPTHLVSGDTINTTLDTGVYICESGVEGMPSEFANATGILEVTLYERFQFQKIHKHGSPHRTYVRYLDANTPRDWVLLDSHELSKEITKLQNTTHDLVKNNVVQTVLHCNSIDTGENDKYPYERQRAYSYPLDTPITEDMVGTKLPINMSYCLEYADYLNISPGKVGFKVALSESGNNFIVNGSMCLPISNVSSSSVVNDNGIVSVYYETSITITPSMVGARYLYVYQVFHLKGDTTLDRQVTIFSEKCYGSENITIKAHYYGCRVLKTITPSVVTPLYQEVDNVKGRITSLENTINSQGSENLSKEQIILHNRIDTVGRRNEFAWDTFDKAYVTLVFDDGRHDVDTVFQIFKEEDVACSLAIPSSWLGNRIDSGRTNIELVRELIQDPKNEFLGHSNKHTGITGNVTEETVLMELRDSQLKYMEYGLQVDGTMLAGARDHLGEYAVSNYEDAGWGYIARRYYKYGDNIDYSPQYRNPRKNFNQSLEKSKADVDNAIANKTWLRYFAHTLDGSEANLSAENLREYIRYVKSKGTDKIEFITFRDMYNRFGSSQLELRIKALESKI